MGAQIQTKAVVSVSEMARMVGLSRARFYQLQQAGVFPPPLYDVSNRRPIYVQELQDLCLEVRRKNCGIDGRPILFYARGNGTAPKRTKSVKGDYADLLDALKSLGLTSVTAAQVGPVVQELFPNGMETVDRAEVIRTIFVHLKRQYSGDNVRR